jgi:hypothetical protein
MSVSSRSSSPSFGVDSSPPSSPSLGPIDSSPPQSPSSQPTYALNSPLASPFVHPFSGSAKATRRHPQYEKRYSHETTPSSSGLPSPQAVRTSLKRVLDLESEVEADILASPSPSQRQRTRVESSSSIDPRDLWDEAITRAVDDGKLVTTIDLTYVRVPRACSSILSTV